MAGLSKTEIDTHCNRLLTVMTAHVVKRLGVDAADHAGECLFIALGKYDTDRGDLDVFIRSKTLNLVKDTLRALNGRTGTKKNAAISGAVQEFESYDTAVVNVVSETPLEKREQLATAVKTLGRLRAVPRWLLLARMFSEFTNLDLTRMLDVSERQLCREASEVRQLLRPD